MDIIQTIHNHLQEASDSEIYLVKLIAARKAKNTLAQYIRSSLYIPVELAFDMKVDIESDAIFTSDILSIFSDRNKMNYVINVIKLTPEACLMRDQHCTDMRWDTTLLATTHIPSREDFMHVEVILEESSYSSILTPYSFTFDSLDDAWHAVQQADFPLDNMRTEEKYVYERFQ